MIKESAGQVKNHWKAKQLFGRFLDNISGCTLLGYEPKIETGILIWPSMKIEGTHKNKTNKTNKHI